MSLLIGFAKRTDARPFPYFLTETYDGPRQERCKLDSSLIAGCVRPPFAESPKSDDCHRIFISKECASSALTVVCTSTNKNGGNTRNLCRNSRKEIPSRERQESDCRKSLTERNGKWRELQ